jgi:hypothetical protein
LEAAETVIKLTSTKGIRVLELQTNRKNDALWRKENLGNLQQVFSLTSMVTYTNSEKLNADKSG